MDLIFFGGGSKGVTPLLRLSFDFRRVVGSPSFICFIAHQKLFEVLHSIQIALFCQLFWASSCILFPLSGGFCDCFVQQRSAESRKHRRMFINVNLPSLRKTFFISPSSWSVAIEGLQSFNRHTCKYGHF